MWDCWFHHGALAIRPSTNPRTPPKNGRVLRGTRIKHRGARTERLIREKRAAGAGRQSLNRACVSWSFLALVPPEHSHQTGCHIFQHLRMTKMLTDVACLGVGGGRFHVCLHPVLRPPDSGPWVHSGYVGTQTKGRPSSV